MKCRGFLVNHFGFLSERVPPQPQPRIQKLLQQYNGKSYGSNLGREPDDISSHHRDQPQSDAYDKYSPGEAPERNYSVNQNEMQRERQRPGVSFALLRCFFRVLGKSVRP